MHTIYINDTSKHITIPDDLYTWMRDISDPCVLTYDDEIGLETIDSADFVWWRNAYETHQAFYALYETASDEHKKLVDTGIAGCEFNDRAPVGIATLKNLGY